MELSIVENLSGLQESIFCYFGWSDSRSICREMLLCQACRSSDVLDMAGSIGIGACLRNNDHSTRPQTTIGQTWRKKRKLLKFMKRKKKQIAFVFYENWVGASKQANWGSKIFHYRQFHSDNFLLVIFEIQALPPGGNLHLRVSPLGVTPHLEGYLVAARCRGLLTT